MAGEVELALPPSRALRAFASVATALAERYGHDSVRLAVAGAMQEPAALYPFAAHAFERHFSALLARGKRVEAVMQP